MKRVFMICGPAGAGKSTWVDEQITKFGGYHVSRDGIRFALLDEHKETDNYFRYENEVIRKFLSQAQMCIDNEKNVDVYLDATHLTKSSRNQILNNLNLDGCKLIAVSFIIPLKVCLERNSKRTGRAEVPEDVIKNMHWRFNPPKTGFDEYWEINEKGERIK